MGKLKPHIWPDRPSGFDRNRLALLLRALPVGTTRADARVLARQALREALGGLLAQPVEQVTLVESAHGPVLEGAARHIRISLSYAGDWALIGLAEERALGVDMVRVDGFPEAEALARLYLPVAACHRVLDVPRETRDACFAQGWAEMEACSKCLGLPLAEINAERELALKACSVVACDQVDGYRIAVAVKQPQCSVAR